MSPVLRRVGGVGAVETRYGRCRPPRRRCRCLEQNGIRRTEWRGNDSEGRPCLVLTARLLYRYIEPQPEVKLLQQHFIYMAEKGVHSCDEQKVEHACIIYGRRAMESRHTSVTLHNAIRPILHSVNRFYSRERVGRLYIVHFVNLVYSIFLSALLKPLLSLLDDSSKLVSVQTKLELRDYFEISLPSVDLHHRVLPQICKCVSAYRYALAPTQLLLYWPACLII